jgi:dTDP-4-dehydrorhamnose 3,5-epimerase
MEIIKTELEGVLIIKNNIFQDERGKFIKTYNEDEFKKNDICINLRESYFSLSKKNVIRGMHFQLPPFEHDKLVYVAKGKILDVILDLRKNSKTFGKYECFIFTRGQNNAIYIPKLFAVGILALGNNNIIAFNCTNESVPEICDGIIWNDSELNIPWPINKLGFSPVVSEKDKKLNRFSKISLADEIL